jgi:hypothetical protein
MAELTTALTKLKRLWAAGDWRAALHLAAGWPRLGPEKEAITRGWAAVYNPELYAEMGGDPACLVSAALAALRARYGLPPLPEGR